MIVDFTKDFSAPAYGGSYPDQQSDGHDLKPHQHIPHLRDPRNAPSPPPGAK
jgi:hypothetical protein